MERLADRLGLGRRLDGYDILLELGHDLERTVAPDEVGPKVTEAVRSGVGARWVRRSD